MSDTLFFKAKLKRTVNPVDVFEKIEKKVNKKKEYSGFCKIYFNLEDNVFEKSSEFKALLDIFYSVKSNFSLIEFSDDYGLATEYWDSKKFKFGYRELTVDEYERVERLYVEGYTKHEELLRAIMAEDMEMPYWEFVNYENPDISAATWQGKIENTLMTYLYETSEFQKEGRISDALEYFAGEPDNHTFALWAFTEGISWIFCDGSGKQNEITLGKHRCMIPKLSQIDLVYREKFVPLFIHTEDAFMRCILSYRYFLSVYEFLGFKYVGHKSIKLVIDEVMEEFGS